jgi:predicted NBD/HSP70 family sugar kinase
MAKAIGVTMSQRVAAGLLADHKLAGPLHFFPDDPEQDDALVELPRDSITEVLCKQVLLAANKATDIAAIGVAVPGLVRAGIVQDSPNLPQMKGSHVQDDLTAMLRENGLNAPVTLLNDADAVAAGLAALHGHLDRMIRVWTLGNGIGYGRYPFTPGVWEGGHTVVTLDPKETFCGCGGRGHLEGIMGHRAMRLRFMDMEPDEVFAAAKNGDERCLEFKKLWHRALAAATATSIHQAGPGKFFVTGFNVRFVDLPLLTDYLQQMVKMGPLQNYSVELVPASDETDVIGAGVAAEHMSGF